MILFLYSFSISIDIVINIIKTIFQQEDKSEEKQQELAGWDHFQSQQCKVLANSLHKDDD